MCCFLNGKYSEKVSYVTVYISWCIIFFFAGLKAVYFATLLLCDNFHAYWVIYLSYRYNW